MNKPTAFIFFGIILVGLSLSFFSLRGCRDKRELAETEIPVGISAVPPGVPATPSSGPATAPAAPDRKPAPAAPAPAGNPAAPAQASDPKVPAPVSTPAAPGQPSAGPTVVTVFKSTEAALSALSEKIGARDFAGLTAVAGPGAIAEAAEKAVRALVENPDLKLNPAKPRVEISKSAEGLRWAFNLVPTSGGEATQLYVDLKEMPDDTVDIVKLSLPLDLARAQAGGASPGDGAASAEAADALSVAHAFSEAVVRRQFKAARHLSDPGSVTDERIAALMIAVEEGGFRLKEERPLVVTLAREDVTWVLSRVESPGMPSSEFAVELARIDQAWKVNGLTFSKVLSALSDAAGAGSVAYSPIVENPTGGDSLVLYFEFDQSGLTPRTERQLKIVADILNQGAERVIRISGHADAVGSDTYNNTLSDRRAEAIRQALISNGVKPEQVVTEAFGASKPRKPNFLPDGSDNPLGRSENRRAEVLLDF